MNKYLFLDIYNGESYSDSYAKLIKSKNIKEMTEYAVNQLPDEAHNVKLNFDLFGKNNNCFEITYNNYDDDSGIIVCYEWELVKNQRILVIEPTVCNHFFDNTRDNVILDYARESEQTKEDNLSDSEIISSLNGLPVMHSNEDFSDNVDFMIYDLNNYKDSEIQILAGKKVMG
tara:strand:- start:201 stop:719 length:519 start_codon:yes stop_codon:yes gene_type:complete